VLLRLDPIRVFSPVFSPMQRPRRNQALFLPPVRVAAPGPNPRFQPRFFANAALAAKPVAVMDSSYKQITANQRLSNDGSGRCHPPP